METRAPCFARLQVIDDPVPRSGPVNMALDEILLGSLADMPVLRFYAWAKPAVSFGYFVPAESARAVAQGSEVVRRWTGGGIVEHGDDLTYSLIVPRSCQFATLGSTESYRQVHDAVAETLARVGFAAHPYTDTPTTALAMTAGNVCFDRPVRHDLLVDERKVAGAAQRRNRTGLLHQGSIRLSDANPDTWHRWTERLRGELSRTLADDCEARTLTPEEIVRAHALAVTKYATTAWTEKF